MVRKLLMMLLGVGLVVGLSLPALAVGEVELHKLTASDAAAENWFGYSVAISGTTALVGAQLDDDAASYSGSAYLYDFSDPCNITETKLTASDAAGGDYFGHSVVISGSTALVGAYGNDDAASYSGSAYLFDVATGSQIAKLTASDAAYQDFFGLSVALSGTTALVGAFGNDDAGSQSGSAYLYDFSDPCNIIETKLTASDAAAGDEFGYSVALSSGTTALVGARWDDGTGTDSGSVYLFDVSDPCNPVQIAKLTASDAAAEDKFGYSVALSGNTAIVGAYRDDDAGGDSGSAYLFDFSDPCNIIEIKLTASDAASSDYFGHSVALNGTTALVGAYGNDDACPFDLYCNSGLAYLYDFSDPCSIIETKLTASDTAAGDYFGRSVAFSGNTAIVGAFLDDDACPDNPDCDSGSAYIFVREPILVDIDIDIKPGSCPNPVNIKSKGVLPVAILGTDDYDVTTIDPNSIGFSIGDVNVGAIRYSYEDVAAPVSDENECECTVEGPDGYTDLTLKFETQAIVEALGQVTDGEEWILLLTGVLHDDTPIEAEDCIVIRSKSKPTNRAGH